VQEVKYSSVEAHGIKIFYREAGPADDRRFYHCMASAVRRKCYAISCRSSLIAIA
jgi:hypothetical protein